VLAIIAVRLVDVHGPRHFRRVVFLHVPLKCITIVGGLVTITRQSRARTPTKIKHREYISAKIKLSVGFGCDIALGLMKQFVT
jgi:hypothetical protein